MTFVREVTHLCLATHVGPECRPYIQLTTTNPSHVTNVEGEKFVQPSYKLDARRPCTYFVIIKRKS